MKAGPAVPPKPPPTLIVVTLLKVIPSSEASRVMGVPPKPPGPAVGVEEVTADPINAIDFASKALRNLSCR